jgi:hypothetical protein
MAPPNPPRPPFPSEHGTDRFGALEDRFEAKLLHFRGDVQKTIESNLDLFGKQIRASVTEELAKDKSERRGDLLKQLGAMAGLLLTGMIGTGALVRAPTQPSPAPPTAPSAYDRAIEACKTIDDPTARGQCAAQVMAKALERP